MWRNRSTEINSAALHRCDSIASIAGLVLLGDSQIDGDSLMNVGTPLDIARLAVFLCSDDAEYIVGQTIVADGGTVSLMSLISDFRNEATTCFGKGYLPGL